MDTGHYQESIDVYDVEQMPSVAQMKDQ
jgi:hypothetical protein